MRNIYFFISLHFFSLLHSMNSSSWPPKENSAEHHYYCLLHGIPGLNPDQIRDIVEGRMRLIPMATKRILPMQLLIMGALGVATIVSDSIQSSQKKKSKKPIE